MHCSYCIDLHFSETCSPIFWKSTKLIICVCVCVCVCLCTCVGVTGIHKEPVNNSLYIKHCTQHQWSVQPHSHKNSKTKQNCPICIMVKHRHCYNPHLHQCSTIHMYTHTPWIILSTRYNNNYRCTCSSPISGGVGFSSNNVQSFLEREITNNNFNTQKLCVKQINK